MSKTVEQLRAEAVAAVAKAPAEKTDAEKLAAAVEGTDPKVAALQQQLADAMQLVADLSAANARLTNPAPDNTMATKLEPRTYFSVVPFCKLHVMKSPGYCVPVEFIAGRLETTDPAVIVELEKLVDKPGTGITSVDARKQLSEDEMRMRADLAQAAATAHGKMVAAGLSTA